MTKMNKLRVFDFDETLVKTNSKVFILRDGEEIELTAEQFTYWKHQDGDCYDFTDFDQVVEPIIKKHEIVLRKCLFAGTSDVVILTARADGAQGAIKSWLVDNFSKKANKIKVITLGSSDPYDKALWIRNYCDENEIRDIYFADDSWDNCRAVGDVMNDRVDVMKVQKV